MSKRRVLITGKLPPPFMGPSVAFQTLINSGLKEIYDLSWFNVQANKSLNTLGKWSLNKIFSNLNLYIDFYRKVKREQPELVLIPISQSTTGFLKDAVFILISYKFGVKVLIQLRGSNFRNWIQGASSPVKAMVRYVISKTAGVIVLGQKLKYLFEDYFSSDKIYVVPNGADINLPPAHTQPDGILQILYLGNLQRSKGIEDVISAVVLLNQQRPGKFSVVVAGNWREDEVKQYCEETVRGHQLPVHFAGPVSGDKKLQLLADSDLFVFTPREPEGHPWTIVEAMASSMPVVATDQGAITESIADNINGFIVPVMRPEAIAEKLTNLIDNEEQRTSMGTRNRQDYLDRFTEGKMIDQYSIVFDTVLGSR